MKQSDFDGDASTHIIVGFGVVGSFGVGQRLKRKGELMWLFTRQHRRSGEVITALLLFLDIVSQFEK